MKPSLSARVLALSLALAPALPARGNEAATALIRYGEQQLRGRSTQALMTMVVKKPGYTRTLRLRAWTVGNQKALVEILEPAKERGIASLRVTNQMWNYLPKTDQVVRVPTSMMLQSWMGSDFTNDDLMKSSSLERDYRHRIVKTELVNGEPAILVECRPRAGAPVVWGTVHYWARQSDKLPLRESYFDERGRWIRTLTFGGFRPMDDRVIPTIVRVNVRESREQSTTITYERVLYDRVIDENVFSRDLIRRTVQAARDVRLGWSTAPLPGRKVAAMPAAPARKKRTIQAGAGFGLPR